MKSRLHKQTPPHHNANRLALLFKEPVEREISEKLLLLLPPLLHTGGAFWGVCLPASSRAQKQSRDPSKLDLLNGSMASGLRDWRLLASCVTLMQRSAADAGVRGEPSVDKLDCVDNSFSTTALGRIKATLELTLP